MKKNISLLALILCGSLSAAVTEVVWDGSAFNVTDQNVKIKNDDIELAAGTTTIQAVSTDIDVKIKKAHLQANAQGASTLNLVANEGRLIRVHIEKELKLEHSEGEGETEFPISLTMQGAGSVEIIMNSDND